MKFCISTLNKYLSQMEDHFTTLQIWQGSRRTSRNYPKKNKRRPKNAAARRLISENCYCAQLLINKGTSSEESVAEKDNKQGISQKPINSQQPLKKKSYHQIIKNSKIYDQKKKCPQQKKSPRKRNWKSKRDHTTPIFYSLPNYCLIISDWPYYHPGYLK